MSQSISSPAEAAFEFAPVGLLLLSGTRIRLANRIARTLLTLPEAYLDQTLRVDGPDGPLAERVLECAKRGEPRFTYQLPQQGQSVTCQIVEVDTELRLLRIDSATVDGGVEQQQLEQIARAFHDLKTPLAVLMLGLSNLSTYYERMSDEQRSSEIADMAESAETMNQTFARLFEDLRSTIRRTPTAPHNPSN